MRCPQCDSENRAGARFCAQCGRELPQVAQEGARPESPAVGTAELPSPQGMADIDVADEGAPEPATEAVPVAGAPVPFVDIELAEEIESGGEPSLDQGDGEGGEVAIEPIEEPALDPERAPAPAEPEAQAGGAADQVSDQPPLVPGTLLHRRYEVVEVLESGPEGLTYLAHDLIRCPSCGYVENAVDGGYCGQCGAVMDAPLRCIIREIKVADAPPVADQFEERGYIYRVELTEAEEEPDIEAIAVRWEWGLASDVGLQRQVNQDSVDGRVYAAHDGPWLGLFVIADGVGGQEHGEVASQLASETIWERIRSLIWEPEMRGLAVDEAAMRDAMTEAVQAANRAVHDLRLCRGTDMGTTATVALLRDDLAVLANVGDSRGYVWGEAGLARITVDHSVVESLVAAGKIGREEVYTHPQRNIIHRSLGDRPEVEVDLFVRTLVPGERLLLCCDGLWEMAREEGIADVLLQELDPQRACDALVNLANLAGGEDNVSVAIVQMAQDV